MIDTCVVSNANPNAANTSKTGSQPYETHWSAPRSQILVMAVDIGQRSKPMDREYVTDSVCPVSA